MRTAVAVVQPHVPRDGPVIVFCVTVALSTVGHVKAGRYLMEVVV